VLVNGQIAIDHAELANTTAGRALRKPKKST
jgi:hypothetical protein